MKNIEIHENNKSDENEIHSSQDKNEKLNIEQFELNNKKNHKSQQLFHHILSPLICEYNKNGNEENKKIKKMVMSLQKLNQDGFHSQIKTIKMKINLENSLKKQKDLLDIIKN